MNLHTMRLIASMPENRPHPSRAARAAPSLTRLMGRVLPTILAVVIGGHLML